MKDFEFCIKYINVKDHLLQYKSLCCNKNYQKMFGRTLKKRFAILHNSSNHNIKFISCINDQEKFGETSFPENQTFYSHLNMTEITDVNYTHAKKVRQGF